MLFYKYYAPACILTARQYGEVVLPDAASGQDPGTLAIKLSRCKEGMAHFLPSRYKILKALGAIAVQGLIGVQNLSPVTKLVAGTGPPAGGSRYKLSRSQKIVTVQDLNCGQMRVSRCKDHYKFVLGAGAKAKSVTNNLPILSVLAFRFILKLSLVELFSIRQSLAETYLSDRIPKHEKISY